MALRLAGEPFLAIRGADNQGWVREVTVQDSSPGLKINQQGTGRVFDFQDGGVSKVYLPDGGALSLAANLAFQQASTISTTAGDLTLNPAGDIECGGKIIKGVSRLDGEVANAALLIRSRRNAAGGALALQTFKADLTTLTNRLNINGGADQVIANWLDCKFNFSTGYPTQTTVGAAGTASALPSAPDGYLSVQVGGAEKVIPYYAQA